LNLVAIGQGTLATAKTPAVKAADVNTESDTISMNDDVNSTATALPDIYFIIPDRMPSIAAELEDGFTGATAFQQSLENLGFQVWPDSLSSDPLKNTQTTVLPQPDAALCRISLKLWRSRNNRSLL